MSPSHIKATSEDDDTIASVGAELFAAPLRCRLSEARKEAIVVCSVDVCQMIVFFLHASTCALASSTAAVASVASLAPWAGQWLMPVPAAVPLLAPPPLKPWVHSVPYPHTPRASLAAAPGAYPHTPISLNPFIP